MSQAFAQKSDFEVDSLKRDRLWLTSGGLIGGAAISYVGLGTLWYNNYPRSGFHFFNDNNEWLQMDKVGHAMTSYYLGVAGYNSLRWSGVNQKTSLIVGGGLGFFYLTGVELFDAYSSEWGFSPGDEMANLGGTLLFIGQQWIWNEQRIRLKYSFHPTDYSNFRPDVLGKNLIQQSLKDYNGQTYWLSLNISSFMKEDNRFPKWLNLAVGYGAEGMISASPDVSVVPKFNRYRQYYFSLDIDLSKIRSRNKTVNTIKNIFNFIKIPFPTVEYSVDKAWFVHPLFF